MIRARIELNNLFIGGNANITAGWKEVVTKAQLEPLKTPNVCKQQWANLVKDYKSINDSRSGDGTGEEAPHKNKDKNWEFYDLMHLYASEKHNFNPILLMDSSAAESPIVQEKLDSWEDLCEEVEEDGGYDALSNFSVSETLSSISGSPVNSRENQSPNENSVASSSGIGKKRKLSKQAMRDDQISKLLKQDKKTSKKIDNLISVFGQVVKKEYPDLDVSSLTHQSIDSDSD
jgi:hypothetical protein